MNRKVSRFDCPSASLSLKALLRDARNTLWIGLGLAVAGHLSLSQVGGFSDEKKTVKPLTTQFIKRQPRLTKPLELKKHPRPKRRMMQRKMVSVKAQADRQGGSGGVRVVSVVQNLAKPRVDVDRKTVFQSSILEPDAIAQAVSSERQAKAVVDMSLEMMDIHALDTGKYQAMVIQDPNDKRNIRGFFHLAIVYSVSMRKGRWTNSDPARLAPLANLVKALNKWTDIKADLRGRYTFDDEEMLMTPWIYAVSSSGAFACTEGELQNLGRYLTSGGFFLADGIHLRQTLKDGLGTQGIMHGKDWEFERLPDSHPVYHCYFDFPEGPPIAGDWTRNHPNPGTPRTGGDDFLEGIALDHRLVCIAASKWFANPWGDWGPENHSTLGHAGIYYKDLDPTRQLQFGVNMIIFALTQEGSITNRVMDAVR